MNSYKKSIWIQWIVWIDIIINIWYINNLLNFFSEKLISSWNINFLKQKYIIMELNMH